MQLCGRSTASGLGILTLYNCGTHCTDTAHGTKTGYSYGPVHQHGRRYDVESHAARNPPSSGLHMSRIQITKSDQLHAQWGLELEYIEPLNSPAFLMLSWSSGVLPKQQLCCRVVPKTSSEFRANHGADSKMNGRVVS